MKNARPDSLHSMQVWIYVGATLFLVALLVSAILVPDLRSLHAFQALIYIAVIVLARRNSPWGYGAGFTIAIVWNGMSLFVTHLIQAGAVTFWLFLRTGHVQQLVPMIVTLGGIGHFILMVATILAVIRNADTRKWWKFAGGGLLLIAYFAVIVVFSEPH